MPILNFQNLMGSPLGMAGLGLLMQPTRSYQPINPMTGIAQGMLAAGQYRQNEAESQIAQQRAEMERQRLQFEMEDSLRKREQEAAARAEADRLRTAQEAYMAGRPPEEQALAAAMGLPAYMAAVGKQQFAEPAGPQSAVGKLAADLRAANPALTAQEALAEAERKTAELKRAGAPSVEVNTGGPFKVPTGFMMTPDGLGVQPIPGGPADPNTPKPVGAEVQAMNIGMAALEKGLGDYVAMLDKFNPRNPADWADPVKRAAIEPMRANLVLQAKEMQRLGALTGPDVAILEQMMADPVSLKGAFFGQGGLKTQIEEYKKIIANRRAATNEETGRSPNPVSASGEIVPSAPTQNSNVKNWSDL